MKRKKPLDFVGHTIIERRLRGRRAQHDWLWLRLLLLYSLRKIDLCALCHTKMQRKQTLFQDYPSNSNTDGLAIFEVIEIFDERKIFVGSDFTSMLYIAKGDIAYK